MNIEVTKEECFRAGVRAGKIDMAIKIRSMIQEGYDLEYIETYLEACKDIIGDFESQN